MTDPASASVEERAGLGSFQAIAAVCLCGIFAFLNLYVTQPMLPLLEGVFHTSKSVVGLTVSAATLGRLPALTAPYMAYAEWEAAAEALE